MHGAALGMTLISLFTTSELSREHRVDLDGDGRIERVVGAPRGRVAGMRTGFVEVRGALGGLRFRLAGDSRGDRFGWSVAVVADVNRDGVRDVLVGAPLDDANGNASGSAYLFSGKDGRRLWAVHGSAARQQLGYAVRAVVDRNGDGCPDVAVGAPFASRGGQRQVGCVRTLCGRTGQTLSIRYGARRGGQYGKQLLAVESLAAR